MAAIGQTTRQGAHDEAGRWSRFIAFVAGPRQARAVWLLTAAMLAAGLALNQFVIQGFEQPAVPVHISWWAFAILVAIIEYPQIRLFVRNEGHSFTLGEMSLCIGLFMVSPDHLVFAAALGVLVSKCQLPPIKVAFNVSLWIFQSALAVVIFHALDGANDPFGIHGLVAAFVAMTIVGLIAAWAVWLAIGLVNGRLSGGPAGIATTIAIAVNIANTGLGLTAVYLIAQDPQLLIALVGPIAVLFLSYRAFVLEHQRHQRLKVVYRATRSILEAPEIGTAIEAVLDQAREVFRADIAQVVLFPERPDEHIVVTTHGPGDARRSSATVERLDGTLFSAIELTRRAEVLLPHELTYRGGLVGIAGEDLRGVIVAPLEGERRVVGAMAVANRVIDGTSFDTADLDLLETLAGHAGVAIGNGRLERTLDELTELQAELSERATHDALTGLANRAHFAQRLQEALDARDGADVGVIYVDVDDFKLVNDTHGHAGGDRTLQAIATRLKGALRTGDLAGRLGGDEFAVIVHDVDDLDQLARMCDRIQSALQLPITLPTGSQDPRLSLGVALAGEITSADILLSHGDAAMYHAKRSGKGRLAVYDASVRAADQGRAELVAALEAAARNGELVLDFQPIIALRDRHVAAVEALVRWRRPGIGVLPPSQFMPLADEVGLATQIGEWVIREACGQVARWNLSGVGPGDLSVHVNLAPSHTLDPMLAERVMEVVHATGLEPGRLVLELTEGVLNDIDAAARDRLNALRAAGVRIALDDFGTGLSSLAGLGGYPVDLLKIPGAFLEGDASRPTLADALVTIGRTLGIPTVAEMIETPDQVARLERLGCELAQGHAFATAIPATEMELWLLAAQRAALGVETPVR